MGSPRRAEVDAVSRPADEARSWAWLLPRAALIVPGLIALGLGLAVPVSFYEQHFSPDRHIAEPVYLDALRVAFGVTGVSLVSLGFLASRWLVVNIAVACSAVFLTVVGLEALLQIENRVLREQVLEPKGLRASTFAGLEYENTPNFAEGGDTKFNSLGMRDEERVFPPGIPTLVVVGDSIEAWRAVPVASLYPRILESLLAVSHRSRGYRVVNLGVSGYSLRQKVQMLKYRGLGFHPDLVVVGYCLNDPIPAGELVERFSGRSTNGRWRSELATLVDGRVRTLLHGVGIDFYHAVHEPESESWREVRASLHELASLASGHRFKVVVVIFPLLGDTRIDYPWRDIHERVRSAATEEGLHVVDLFAPFARVGFDDLREDGVHPNAAGHRVAATALHDAIVAEDLLRDDHGIVYQNGPSHDS